jgi:hypothetical protein
MSRVTRDELIAALGAADQDLEQSIEDAQQEALLLERLNLLGAGPGELAEGEQAAVMAEPPRERVDGKAWGTGGPRPRPLTEAQARFAQGLIEGKTLKASYRDAYPNSSANDGTVAAAAHRLSKHPRIAAMVRAAWDESVEALTDDVQATKRYVVKSLLHMVQTASHEATRLRALENLGRASGAFTPAPMKEEKAVTPDQLRRELQGHLRLLDNVKPMRRTGTHDASVNSAGARAAAGDRGADPTVAPPPAARE